MSLQLSPYLLMNGKAEEAIRYYEKVLGAELLFKQTIGEGPEEERVKFKESEQKYLAHAVIQIGDTKVMLADLFLELPFQQGNQVSICITTQTKEEAQQIYGKLAEEGEVIIELEEVYFSPAYGMVKDKFGVMFQIFTARNQ
ncbi:VOC family protein [Fictibacillus barbaricus]|uniref:VOC family protein n=1 Tax=Fictibacillus barbaricus TaxID=182136 RepID=A0ABS2ZAA0_9BACL|nr:VOC family protein [Fictibacillus barbaricus]MBN3545114.1 VOC family protein [Fictibacillus barbaricus]GGB61603.1 protein PhnB [Fictibacillus barbaricus]